MIVITISVACNKSLTRPKRSRSCPKRRVVACSDGPPRLPACAISRAEVRQPWARARTIVMANRADRTQITRALLQLARADLQRRVRPRRADVGAAGWSSGWACLARRCAWRSPGSSTRVCCAACPAAGTSCASSRGGTSPTRSSFGACSRGPQPGSRPSEAPPRRELQALRTTNDAIQEVVHRADYESFERYVDLNESFHARLLKIARSPLLERALDSIISLPFAGPERRFVLAEAELPESRDILIVAHRHHDWLIEAIEPARARELRAWPASTRASRWPTSRSCSVIGRCIERLPGAALVTLPADPVPGGANHQPAPADPIQPRSGRRGRSRRAPAGRHPPVAD